MTQQRSRKTSGGRLDFPGAFTAAGVGVIVAAVWPWIFLHGVARVVTGIIWTVLILVVAGLIAAGRSAGKSDSRKAAPPKNVATSVRYHTTVTARGSTISFRGSTPREDADALDE